MARQAPAAPKTQKTEAVAEPKKQVEPTATTEISEPATEPEQPDTIETSAPRNTSIPFVLPQPREKFEVEKRTFHAEDGTALEATLYLPTDSLERLPGVIILPMYMETRQAWDKSARLLAEGGYAVLTLDLRGQGESGGASDWIQSVADVQRVWGSFTQNEKVDRVKTAFIGSSNGANIALNAAVGLPEVRTVVLVSPILNFNGVTSNDPLSKLGDRKILVVSGAEDPISGSWPEEMQGLAPGQVTLRMLPAYEHGTYLMASQPQSLNIIQKWLDDQMSASPTPNSGGQTSLWPILLVCLACLTGLLVLVVGLTLLNRMAHDTFKNSSPLPIEKLYAGMRAVSIGGKIGKVHDPLNLQWGKDIAAVYLCVEETVNGAWAIKAERGAASSFTLEDRSGSILIEKAAGHLAIQGKSSEPKGAELDALLKLLGITDLKRPLTDYRFKLWQIQGGQEIVVTGAAENRFYMLPSSIIDGIQPTLESKATTALRPKQRGVRVQGRITTLLEPQDADPQGRLTLRRAVVEEDDPKHGRVIVFERWFATDFRLQDNYGGIWIRPITSTLAFKITDEEMEAEDFKKLVDDPALEQLSPQKNYHYRVHDLHAGAEISILGNTSKNILIFTPQGVELAPAGAPLMPIGALRTGQGRVRLTGKIMGVETPLERQPPLSNQRPLALLRVATETATGQEYENNPRLAAKSNFWLEDSTGSIRVLPTNPVGDCLGPGVTPNWTRLESALRFLGVDAAPWKNRPCKLWELRQGDTITLSGIVSDQRSGPRPQATLVLIPLDDQTATRLTRWYFASRKQIIILLTFGLGASLLCCIAVGVVMTIRQFWN